MAQQVSIEEVQEMFARIRENTEAELLKMCKEFKHCNECGAPTSQLLLQLNQNQINRIIVDTIKCLTEGEDNFTRMITILNANPELRALFCNNKTDSWKDHPELPRVQEAFCADGRMYDIDCLVHLCGLMESVCLFGLDVFERDCINEMKYAITESIERVNLLRIQ